MTRCNLKYPQNKPSPKPAFWLLLFLAFHTFSCSQRDTDRDEESGTPIVTAEAGIRDLSSHRTVTAPVVAYQRIYITARTSGQVMEINAEEGDHVRAGELLVRLDTRRQQAQLQQAEATLEEARHHYRRQRQLFESEVIPEAEYDAASRQLKSAEADARLWEVEVDLGQIEAPIHATVTDRLIETGTNVSENQRLFTIEDHNLLVVRPGIPEKDVVHLSKGQDVELSFDVFPDRAARGTIRRIFPAADTISRLFTVEVEVDQESIPGAIYPGFLARVHFTTDERTDVVTIPHEALLSENGKDFVFVLEGETVRQREIEPGVRRDGQVEIVAGLEAGEKVAAGNLEVLEDGARVDIRGQFRRHGFGR